MRKENKALWRVAHLFTKLIGDHTWVPCEMMIGPNDIELFSDDSATLSRLRQATGSTAAVAGPGVNGQAWQSGAHGASYGSASTHGLATAEAGAAGRAGDGDVPMAEATTNGSTGTGAGAGAEGHVGKDEEQEQGNIKAEKQLTNGATKECGSGPNGEVPPSDHQKAGRDEETVTQSGAEANPASGGVKEVDRQQDGDGPTGANNSNSKTSEAMSVAAEMLDELFVHPLFRPPPNAQVDRGGLTEAEAEDMRRLVGLYVQKQEEICRGAHKLHEGLLKANRLRKTVLQWAKAEAHCGPNRDMSDGEDWYDKEEWGLTEDLKKGQDEEEEETTTTTTAPKKTRNRRQ